MPLFWRREIEACVWDLHTDSTALSHISAQRGLSYLPSPSPSFLCSTIFPALLRWLRLCARGRSKRGG